MPANDAFTAGVRPGGLTSSTEIRLLLCYLVKNAGPIARQEIEHGEDEQRRDEEGDDEGRQASEEDTAHLTAEARLPTASPASLLVLGGPGRLETRCSGPGRTDPAYSAQ